MLTKLHIGMYRVGVVYMERLAESFPYDYRNDHNLGHAYLRLGIRDKAFPVFRRVHSVNYNNLVVAVKYAILPREEDTVESPEILL